MGGRAVCRGKAGGPHIGWRGCDVARAACGALLCLPVPPHVCPRAMLPGATWQPPPRSTPAFIASLARRAPIGGTLSASRHCLHTWRAAEYGGGMRGQEGASSWRQCAWRAWGVCNTLGTPREARRVGACCSAARREAVEDIAAKAHYLPLPPSAITVNVLAACWRASLAAVVAVPAQSTALCAGALAGTGSFAARRASAHHRAPHTHLSLMALASVRALALLPAGRPTRDVRYAKRL